MHKAMAPVSFYRFKTPCADMRQLSYLNQFFNKCIYITENPHHPIQPNSLANKPYTLLRTKGYPLAQIFPPLLIKQKLTIELKHGNQLYSGKPKFHLTYSLSPACQSKVLLSVQVSNHSFFQRQNQTKRALLCPDFSLMY